MRLCYFIRTGHSYKTHLPVLLTDVRDAPFVDATRCMGPTFGCCPSMAAPTAEPLASLIQSFAAHSHRHT